MRGGARPGSGRKQSEESRVNLTVRVSKETRDRIAVLRSSGVKIGEQVDAMIDELFKNTSV